MRTQADLIKDLEQLGEKAVRSQFLNGVYKSLETYQIVKDWQFSKESERAEVRAEESYLIPVMP